MKHYAARKGYLDICRILIDYGADVNAITPELFSTVSSYILKRFLEYFN